MTPLLYTDLPLDRAGHLRRDEDALGRLAADPRRLVVPVWQECSLVAEERGGGAVLLAGTVAAQAMDLADATAFLGLRPDGTPVFAADLSAMAPAGAENGPTLGIPGKWRALKAVGGWLPASDGALLATARGLMLWLRRTRFCGRCGGPTLTAEGGHSRLCQDAHCGGREYPRLDPAVIMLVEDGERVLLHRQHFWPPGMWSILAGFVETGETLEEAVRREVAEETGLLVADVTYAGSQPWPFPSQMMIGFTARADGGTLTPDPAELEDARWFTRADIAANFRDDNRGTEGGLFLPWPGTIARRMVDSWLTR